MDSHRTLFFGPKDCPENARHRIVYRSESEPLVIAIALAFVLTGAWLTGCDMPPRPPLKPEDIRPARTSESVGSAMASNQQPQPVRIDAQGDWETWDAYFMNNRQVGYSHLVAEPVNDRSTCDIHYRLEDRLYITRGRSRFVQRLLQTSTETKQGQLLGFESSLQVGPAVTQVHGRIDTDLLSIETTRGSSQSARTVPWKSSYRGLVALEQSLRQQPMQDVGETREFDLLLPGKYELARARLYCSGPAAVPLIDGTPAALTEINTEIIIDGQPSYSTIWTDDEGGIVRTYSAALDLISYRTDEATATKLDDTYPDVAAIDVRGAIDGDKWARRAGFKITTRVSAKSQGDSVSFQPAPGQFVRRSSDGSIQVLVSRSQETVPKGFAASDLKATDADRKANQFVDYQASSIRRFAKAAVGSRNLTDREVALELTAATEQMIQGEDDTDGFSKASEVFRNVVGDNTDRAVLLAALLRSHKIPSRLAIGIKFDSTQQNQMRYHVWTLAYVDGQWLHLDASEGGAAAADRLVFATTNLDDGKEYDALIPFLDLLGRINIEIVGAQY
jgi:hypothetical protein